MERKHEKLGVFARHPSHEITDGRSFRFWHNTLYGDGPSKNNLRPGEASVVESFGSFLRVGDGTWTKWVNCRTSCRRLLSLGD